MAIKPKLTIEQQIQQLEKKGISFDLYPKEAAQQYLTDNNYYYKLTAFRKNFRKHPGGINEGKYVHLDFAYLVDLAIIDNYLRNIILEIALDIEHYSKLKLLHKLENHINEDGYEIVKDYFQSLGTEKVNLERRISEKANSTYVGDIIQHCNGTYSVWNLIEIISYGDFLKFYKFCADRWNDRNMMDDYYRMKDVKELRNASAHNNCIINDITIKNAKHKTNHSVMRSLNEISPQRNRKQLSKEKMRQLVTLLYTSQNIITSDGVKTKIRNQLLFFKTRIYRDYDYSFNQTLKAAFDYLIEIFDNFY